ncbi:MAG: PAS domain S-box protein [Kiloniellaceae bacterium]
MGSTIRVLLVEDSPDDADLLLRELRRGGYEPQSRRVDSAPGFIAALDSQEWDAILCDYTMPGFSGADALALLHERGLDIPFIFVSGTLSEEMAVAAMRAGAHDYVVKDRLKRLAPAVERALKDAEARREQARDRAERRTAERRFREILAMAPDAIITTDQDFGVTIYNRAAEALFGYSGEEVHGRPLDLLLPSRYVAIHKSHMADFAEIPGAVRRMNERIEIFGRRKNGEEFPAEAAISRLVEDGHATFMTVIRDISVRKRDEATLRKLTHAVDHSANLIVMTDRKGVIEYVNSSLLHRMGYSAKEVIGNRPSLWKSGRTSAAAYAQLWRTILAGEDWHGEFENRCKNGSLISVSTTIAPIKDESGKITHFISIQEDVTERRALEAQLQQSQRMEAVGQLTGGLAHDFNNLLTIVIGNLDLLLERVAQQEEAAEMARLALDASLRGARLTQQLLAFSRRQPLEPKVFDLNELVADTVDLLRRTLGEQVEIESRFSGDLWPALADPVQLESAFANLAINGRDAMPGGGCLTIETANKTLDGDYTARNIEVVPGEYVMLAVSDNGAGMAPEIVDRVFEPFFTTKELGQGTGLGLSMVYGFAKQSGGHVKIYSELGHGTTVRLYLPRAGAGQRHEDLRAPQRAGAITVDARVLVVEDDPEVRRVAVSHLLALGYRVIEAENGRAALAYLVHDADIDLLFTDVVMPGGMSGPELAMEARRLHSGLKVLFTSGYAESALENKAAAGMAGALLSKPYRKDDLERKLHEVLDSKDPQP